MQFIGFFLFMAWKKEKAWGLRLNENSFLRRSGNDDGIPAFAGGERVPDSSGLRHVSGAA